MSAPDVAPVPGTSKGPKPSKPPPPGPHPPSPAAAKSAVNAAVEKFGNWLGQAMSGKKSLSQMAHDVSSAAKSGVQGVAKGVKAAGALMPKPGPAKNADALPPDPNAALAGFNQKNGPAQGGEFRCGSSVIIAKTIEEKGYKGLQDLAGKISQLEAGNPKSKGPEMKALADKIASGKGTYEDLGKFTADIQDTYKGKIGGQTDYVNGKVNPALSGDTVAWLAGLNGKEPPKQDPAHPFDGMKTGESWPAKINIDFKPGQGNHWVNVGKDDKGPYFYDPDPKPGQSQMVRPGDKNWNKYNEQMQQSGKDPTKGFANRD